MEETGAIDQFPIIAKEGNLEPPPAKDSAVDNDVPDLLHPDDDSSVSDSEYDEAEDELDNLDIPDDLDLRDTMTDDDVSPQPLSDPSSQPRRSTHVRKPESCYAYHTRQYD